MQAQGLIADMRVVPKYDHVLCEPALLFDAGAALGRANDRKPVRFHAGDDVGGLDEGVLAGAVGCRGIGIRAGRQLTNGQLAERLGVALIGVKQAWH